MYGRYVTAGEIAPLRATEKSVAADQVRTLNAADRRGVFHVSKECAWKFDPPLLACRSL
jgi:hypothetical protein